jgi:ubiquinone biosynthesis monooxygenase Coq7
MNNNDRMEYKQSDIGLDTSKKILKVNHAGEFGAVNIYKAQLLVSRFFRREFTPLLEQFQKDEERHLKIFWDEIQKRNGVKCKSFWLCGIGGFFMGALSALFGKPGVMACTWAVESVVTEHLESQLLYLEKIGDTAAVETVREIINDEEHHRDVAFADEGMNALFGPFRFLVRMFTEGVIRFGMR